MNLTVTLEQRFDRQQRTPTILHVAPVGPNSNSGLYHAIPGLVNALHALGVPTGLLTTHPDGPYPEQTAYPTIQYTKSLTVQRLPEPLNKPDLVVFHSTYIPAHAKLAAWCHKRAIPYIICPHGGMTHRAQAIKRLKKIGGNILFFNRMVRHAAALHFLTAGEAQASQKWQKPYFIVPNGVELPDKAHFQPPPDSKLCFVFIGRLDIFIKGLDLLIEACHAVKTTLAAHNVTIALFGPDSAGDRPELEQLISRYQLEPLVHLGGAVHGNEKSAILSSADLFIHTSRFEGHPIAVLEALSFGVPCLLTPGTNMAQIVCDAGAGWQAEPTAAGIAQTLTAILDSWQKLKDKRLNARRLIEEEYTWERIAQQVLRAHIQILSSHTFYGEKNP